MPTVSLDREISLPSKAVLYTDILKMIVQDKRQTVMVSAHNTCRNVRGHGKLSSNSTKHAKAFVYFNPDNSMR